MHFPLNLPPAIARLLPFLKWWPRVNRVTLRADLAAGATGALIVLPQGVAFATIAGMPPEYGLYAAIVPTIVAALFGSSWHLMGGPTTATSIVIFSTMSAVASVGSNEYVQLVLLMSLFAGIFKLAIGVARMGVLVNFISPTVVLGFTAAAAMLIVGSQIQQFFGLSMPRGLGFGDTLQFFATHLSSVDWYVASVATLTLLTAIALKRRFPRAPYLIGAMLIGAVYAYLLHFIPGFAKVHHIATVPALPAPIPAFSPPRFSFEGVRKTLSAAIVVGMVGLTEAISIARAVAARSEQRIDPNQEFIGQGLANIAGAFCSAYAASGSLNRTGLNYEAGAKTPLASVFSALFLVVLLFVVGPLAQYLPIAAMAGVLVLVAWGLVDVPRIRKVLRVSRLETAVLAITFAATLLAELEVAIYLGVIMSLMLYLRRTSQPRVYPRPPDPLLDGELLARLGESGEAMRILRVRGSIFFGATQHVREALEEVEANHAECRSLVIDATGINFVDVTGARMLADEALRRRRLGGALYLYRANEDVRRVLERSGVLKEIGAENVL